MRLGRELVIKVARLKGWTDKDLAAYPHVIDEWANRSDPVENEYSLELIVELAEGNEFAS